MKVLNNKINSEDENFDGNLYFKPEEFFWLR